jgi:hypothetical protein
MNCHSVLDEMFFKFAHGPGRARVEDDREQGRLRNEIGNLTKIISFIGRDAHSAIREKRPVKGDEEVFIHKTARGVPPFWPGIRKHKVKRRDGTLREEPLDDVRNLEPQNARIRQAGPLDFSTGLAHSTQQTLDSQEILLRVFRGDPREKGSLTAAEIDFDRRATPINLFEIEGRETIGGDEFRLVC